MADENCRQKRVEDSIRTFVEQAHAERMFVLSGIKEYGLSTIRQLTLLNGGALVALIAFLASLYGKDPSNLALAKNLTAGLIEPLLCFGIGLSAATLTAAVGYLHFYAAESAHPQPADLSSWMTGTELPSNPARIRWGIPGSAWLVIFLAVASLGAFGFGIHLVVKAFRAALSLHA